ncbi:MAG: hypothetical protein ABW205_05395 [Burkholderiales bacterium]
MRISRTLGVGDEGDDAHLGATPRPMTATASNLPLGSAIVHTLTTDNGKEFAQHERIAATLAAQFFFAHPYASWERGANEK